MTILRAAYRTHVYLCALASSGGLTGKPFRRSFHIQFAPARATIRHKWTPD